MELARIMCRELTMPMLAVGLCLSVAGCSDVATIRSVEVRSPDGRWVARARTEQHGGLGTAGVITTIYLARTDSDSSPVEILELFHNPNSMSNSVDLKIKWQTKSHLDISYGNYPSIDFQAIKCGGIDISTHEISSGRVTLQMLNLGISKKNRNV